MGEEHPSDDVERPSKSTLCSYRSAYEATKQNGPRKLVKITQATLLENLCFHGLNEEVDYKLQEVKKASL